MQSKNDDVLLNINTVDYWNDRFSSGDWSNRGGFSQTRNFALSQLPHLGIAASTVGTICDFGCGAGDAFPVYRNAWPLAELIGIDISSSAIDLCRERFGSIARFICGDFRDVPHVDTVICSNVLEHLDDDHQVVASLLTRCNELKIIVPYNEHPLTDEHVRSYTRSSFDKFNVKNVKVFNSPGWTEDSLRERVSIVLGNSKKLLSGERFRTRRKQVLFEIVSG